MHDCMCFTPIKVSELSNAEKKKAMDAVAFVVEKNPDLNGNCEVKAHVCAKGSMQQSYLGKEDTASPTAAT